MLDMVSGFQSNIVQPWTPERVELLRKLWANRKLSAAKISAELRGGATRNSVLGKVHRLGLSERPRGHAEPRNYPKARRSAKEAPPVAAPRAVPVRAEPPTSSVEPIAIAIPVSRRVTFEELRPHMCKFILGDPLSPDHRWCGSDRQGGSSYCSGHRALCYAGAPAPNTGGRAHAFVGMRIIDSEAA